MPDDSHFHWQAAPVAPESTRVVHRLIWLCPAIGIVAGGVVLWLLGFSLWTAIVIVLLLACPAVIAWVLLIERQQNPGVRGKR